MGSSNQPIDLASLLHILNFIIIGYVIPGQYLLAIFIGIIWEIFESFATKHPTIRSYLMRHVPDYAYLWDETHKNQRWDMVFNLIGYSLGTYLALR